MTSASLESGDCRDVLLELAALGETFHACVTDPPYHLTSTVDRFGGDNAAPAAPGVYGRSSAGFMGKRWDGGDIAFRPETWRLVFDVLKPGAYLLAFGGSRTYHRMACAIEDAGFEIRDSIMWLYGTGFPKSHDISKAIDKAAGAVRTEVVGSKLGRPGMSKDGSNQRSGFDSAFGGAGASAMSSDILAPATPEAAEWAGWGSALKPAFEPIIVARRPLAGTLAANTLAHGCGGLNIDASRIPLAEGEAGGAWGEGKSSGSCWSPGRTGGGSEPEGRKHELGRWPANVMHDGSPEVLEAFAAYGDRGAHADVPADAPSPASSGRATGKRNRVSSVARKDTGTAARFFYSPKAGAADRAGSEHPTVKRLDLMRYLCRLVTRPGGRILDPFAGSGTTLQAAVECGFEALGIEADPGYQADILRRLAAMDAAALEALLA